MLLNSKPTDEPTRLEKLLAIEATEPPSSDESLGEAFTYTS